MLGAPPTRCSPTVLSKNRCEGPERLVDKCAGWKHVKDIRINSHNVRTLRISCRRHPAHSSRKVATRSFRRLEIPSNTNRSSPSEWSGSASKVQWITKDCCGFIKGHAMFADIRFRFYRVPFEDVTHLHPSCCTVLHRPMGRTIMFATGYQSKVAWGTSPLGRKSTRNSGRINPR